MRLLDLRCPSCGGIIGQGALAKVMVCEYCGSRFALDDDEASMIMDSPDDVPEDEPASSLSMEDFAAEACAEFLNELDDDDSFQSAPKILRGLGVDPAENVFLIHDDTFLKSGKNGFAITENGLYCRELGEQATFRDWASFAKMKEPDLDGCYIRCGSHSVCYFTDSNSLLPDLLDLYQKLYKHAKRRA